MHTLMNACLHLAPHEGTAHDLTHATHDKCPDVQGRHAYRPLQALTCKFHKVVFAHLASRPPKQANPQPVRHIHTPEPRATLIPSLPTAVAVLRQAIAAVHKK